MDRQDAKPHRPSLLAAAAIRPTPAAAPGRILADMDNLKSRPRGRKPGGWRLPLLALLLLTVAAAGAYWRFNAPTFKPYEAAAYRAAPEDSAGDATATAISAPTDAPAPEAAMIVSDTDAPGAPAAEPAAANARPAPVAAVNPFATTAPTAAAVPGASVAMAPAAPPRASLRTTRLRAAAPTPGNPAAIPPRSRSEPDLLATLLGNIKRANRGDARATPVGQNAPFAALERPRRGSDQDALDALVRQVRDRDSAAAKSARAAPSPAEQVQAQLRQCPRANTTAGLRCRQRICAKSTGDPACPRS